MDRPEATVRDYQRMAETGILGARDRVERIEGEIIEMAPIGCRYAATVNLLTKRLIEVCDTNKPSRPLYSPRVKFQFSVGLFQRPAAGRFSVGSNLLSPHTLSPLVLPNVAVKLEALLG